MSETEYRTEPDTCYLLNRETGAITTLEGIRIRWRFIGERRWRKKVLVPDEEQGQTVESLLADIDTIVGVLASKEPRP